MVRVFIILIYYHLVAYMLETPQILIYIKYLEVMLIHMDIIEVIIHQMEHQLLLDL